MNAREMRSFILQVVGTLKSGLTTGAQKNPNVTLDNLFPDGKENDKIRNTAPFGFVSGIPKGVAGFYYNLFGSAFETIGLGFLDPNRPEPTGPGETVLYSTDASGKTIKVKIVLGSDGSLTITAPTKVVVNSPDIELGVGTLDALINSTSFLAKYNNHQHEGNMGVPTGVPLVQTDAGDLSVTVKAQT